MKTPVKDKADVLKDMTTLETAKIRAVQNQILKKNLSLAGPLTERVSPTRSKYGSSLMPQSLLSASFFLREKLRQIKTQILCSRPKNSPINLTLLFHTIQEARRRWVPPRNLLWSRGLKKDQI